MPIGWYVVEPPLTAALDADTKRVIASIVGENPLSGQIDADVKKATVAMAGDSPYVGNILAQVKPSLAVLAGSQLISGQLACSLQKAIFAGAGTQTIPGNLVAALNKALFSGNGQHYNNGTVTASTLKLLVALNASQIFTGAIDADVAKAVAQMGEGQTGPIVASTKKLLVNLTAAQIYTGSISAGARKITTSMTGTQILTGSMTAALKKLGFAASGTQANNGTASATLLKATAAFAAALGVTLNSVGAGNRNGTAANPISTNFIHNIAAGANIRVYAVIAVSHANWMNNYNAGHPTCSSSVNGGFTQLSQVFFGDVAGFKQGSITILRLTGPTPGEHTMTFTCQQTQTFSAIFGNTIAFNGVQGEDAPVTQSYTTTTGLLNLTIPDSDEGDVMLVGMACQNAPTFAAGLPSPWHSDGAAHGGDADIIRCLYMFGVDAAQSFTTTSPSQKSAGIAMNLYK